MSHPESNSERTWSIAKPENADRVFYGLCSIAIFLVITDVCYMLYMHSTGPKGYVKGHFAFEDIMGFHAAYGFMAFVVVVMSGTHLRKYLMRPLDYYDVPVEPPHEDEHGHHGDDHDHEEHHDHDHKEEHHTTETSEEGDAQ